MDPNSVVRLVDNCATQGYHPIITTTGTVLNSTLLETANTSGLLGGGQVFPYPLDVPATATFRQSFRQYASGAPTSELEAAAWVGGLILQAASRSLPANPTPADVLAGLYRIKNNSFGGLTQPLTFRKGQPTKTSTCGFTITITNRQYVASKGLTPTCLPASLADGYQ
jgi:hypothetical protein